MALEHRQRTVTKRERSERKGRHSRDTALECNTADVIERQAACFTIADEQTVQFYLGKLSGWSPRQARRQKLLRALN